MFEVLLSRASLCFTELVDVLGGEELAEARGAVGERFGQGFGGQAPRLAYALKSAVA